MKTRYLTILATLIGFALKAQVPATALSSVARIQQWDTAGLKVLPAGNGETELENGHGQVLRFRTDSSGKVVPYHCGIAYQLFNYEKGYLKSVSTFGLGGGLLGEPESEGEATMELSVKKETLLKTQFARLDAQDGNLEFKDEAQQIVLARLYDEEHKLLKEMYISSAYYWQLQHRLYRP
ncbi:hypothetical protein [Taibaiella koreensis]|uniref:hypothetical protein n=1 Tax=Taibaiella koreensis TaxID=1268548 RepID=UPI000E59FCC5|nr:hypothetical protein [Taibaiella koreensis]